MTLPPVPPDVPGPRRPRSPALDARIAALAADVQALVAQALTEGVREGVEWCAAGVEGFSAALTGEHVRLRPLLELICDSFRVAALGIEDPT